MNPLQISPCCHGTLMWQAVIKYIIRIDHQAIARLATAQQGRGHKAIYIYIGAGAPEAVMASRA